MTTVAELAKTLGDVDARLTKAKDEILEKIQELQDSVVNLNLPPEVETALDNLKTQAQALDDIVPDATP